MNLRAVPPCLAVVALCVMSAGSPAEGLFSVPSTISHLLGMPSDITFEFTKYAGIGDFLTRVGLIGPASLGLLSKAGIALGIMGSAATAFSLAAASRDEGRSRSARRRFYDRNYYNYLPQSRPPVNHDRYFNPYQSHFRKKRSVAQPQIGSQTPMQVVDDEKLYQFVYRSDTKQCGERLICELAAKPKHKLYYDEILMLDFVRSKSDDSKSDSQFFLPSKVPYMKADYYGRKKGQCSFLYTKCPFSSIQMMGIIRRIGDKFWAW